MLEKAALVFGQMDEPPGVRLRVALSALTMAEYFRDVQGQDVLLFVDNIFRFVQAGSEVSTLLGRMPSAVGYQPTLADEMGELQERITSTRGRSITSLQAVYVPADDYTDPAPFTTFTHLDATTELSREIASLGIYPAVDPLASTSTILAPEVVGRASLRRGPPGAGGPPALQGAAGHHRHPRPRRALRRGPHHRRPGPQGAAVPVAAVLRGRGLHRPPRRHRLDRGDRRVVRAARQRRPRRPARAGLPQRRRRRLGAGPRPASSRRTPDADAGRARLARADAAYSGEATMVLARTIGGGDIAFLPGHAPVHRRAGHLDRSRSVPVDGPRRAGRRARWVRLHHRRQREDPLATWPSWPTASTSTGPRPRSSGPRPSSPAATTRSRWPRPSARWPGPTPASAPPAPSSDTSRRSRAVLDLDSSRQRDEPRQNGGCRRSVVDDDLVEALRGLGVAEVERLRGSRRGSSTTSRLRYHLRSDGIDVPGRVARSTSGESASS